MADSDLTSRVSSEGRIVIPAELRRRMNLRAGDVIRFGFDEATGRLEILPAQRLIDVMWANNTGGDAGDSGEAMRLHRQSDQQAAADSEARVLADAELPWDEATATARLLGALDLT